MYGFFINEDYYNSKEIKILLKNGEYFYLNEESKSILGVEIKLRKRLNNMEQRYALNDNVDLIINEIVESYIS